MPDIAELQTKDTTTTNLTMPTDLRDRIVMLADRKGMKLRPYMVQLLILAVDREERGQK